MECLNCGQEFPPMTVVQKYCSEKCKRQYYRQHKNIIYPSITFRCAKCGRMVVTDGKKDKRTRFCCETCEKKFWRHPPWERKSPLTNFRSMEEYQRWERRSNEE